MEAIVKIWYETMKKDRKILGFKCKECGAMTFPPVPVCQKCYGMDMEWCEMDYKGSMYAVGYSPSGVQPYYDTPTVFAYVDMCDGIKFKAPLKGVKKKQMEELMAQTPLPVKMEVMDLDDTFAYPCYVLDTEEEA